MVDIGQHGIFGAQRGQEQEIEIDNDLLNKGMQHQSLDSDVDVPKRPMSLLDLPLVIVRQVLQDIVQCYTAKHRTIKLSALLNLREVHSFLDAEVTWLLGRDLDRWDSENRKACLYRAPRSYAVRILESCIGDHDRGDCEFATHMHSVVDTLMEQFHQLGTRKERDEVIHDVSHAFAKRPWQRELFEWRLHVPMRGVLKPWDPIPTAFVVAIHARYDDVVRHMLQTHSTVPSDIETNKECRLAAADSFDFGQPIDMGITSGQTGKVEMLLQQGAKLDRGSDGPTSRALEVAAQRGHSEVIDLVLQRKSLETGLHEILRTVGRIMRMAARHQQWHIVWPLVKEYAQQMNEFSMQDYINSTLCTAARYGQDEVVGRLIKLVDSRKPGFPLRDAASGGHLSTCELLLRKVPKPDPLTITQQSEVFARAIARGGNVDVCDLLRPQRLWREYHEIHFLPIAAELGHLEFAKYAVEKGCDRNPPPKHLASVIPDLDRQVRYPDDVRYFALLRAIISRHQDIVRWMVDELGMDFGRDAELTHPALRPWHLAEHAKTHEKLRLALGLDDDVETCDCEAGPGACKEAAMLAMDAYSKALRLRKDYS